MIPLIKAAEGTVLCRGVFREAIVGDDCPEFIAVMQFPDAVRIHEMFDSAAYRAAIPDRRACFARSGRSLAILYTTNYQGVERSRSWRAAGADGGCQLPVLRNGDVFPNVTIAAVGGGTINVPRDLDGSYGVVLLFRGAWCPYCKAQIAAFSRACEALAKLWREDHRVVSRRRDRVIGARRQDGVRFPVGQARTLTVSRPSRAHTPTRIPSISNPQGSCSIRTAA